ncbi:hypothetical protein HYU10_03695 [Candidatus Woesearchaeota archaeon]|nr:hypothetical protein [Candidatus Woesearchaeota archaeon]MBI2130847.1 hypothetical protein [Candidatus Woesearchaeota archaeon]
MEICNKLYSMDKRKISEALHELLAFPNEESDNAIKELLKNYNFEDNENAKITIRALNKCLYRELELSFLQTYGNILLQNVLNTDGYTRMVVYSVIDRFRLRLLILVDAKKRKELQEYAVEFYSKLAELYEQNNQARIKSSILSCIKTFHCPAFDEIVSKTRYAKTYNKFRKILYEKYEKGVFNCLMEEA